MDTGAGISRAEGAENQLQQVEKDLKSVKDKLLQAHRDLEQARTRNEGLERELGDLKTQAADLKSLHSAGDRRLKEVEKERSELERKVRDADAKCEKLQSCMAQAEERGNVIEGLRMQLEPLQTAEKTLIAQLSAEKGRVQELERQMREMEAGEQTRIKDNLIAEKKVNELKKNLDQRTEEAAQSQAIAKGLQRQVEQAQVQIARMERDLQSSERSKESGFAAEQQKAATALAECARLRDELREKQAEVSRLDFSCDQAKDRVTTVQGQMNDQSTQLQAAHDELESARKDMRKLSEETSRCRIHVDQLEKALANKDVQMAAQFNVLRAEKEELQKASLSLREERRQARSELQRQKSELETFRSFSAATKEAVQFISEQTVALYFW